MTPNQLKEILAQHQLWLDSDGKQGRRADLYRVNLTEANLNGVNLRRANLDEVNLTGADLRGAELYWALLYDANLTGADLRGADLTGADLRGANLTGAQLGPEIRGCVSFEWAKVSEDQLAWLCLHPRFGEWVSGLKITSP